MSNPDIPFLDLNKASKRVRRSGFHSPPPSTPETLALDVVRALNARVLVQDEEALVDDPDEFRAALVAPTQPVHDPGMITKYHPYSCCPSFCVTMRMLFDEEG